MSLSIGEKGAITLGVILLSLVVLLSILVDPSVNGFAPKCFLYSTTGLECPLCGGQRSIHALFKGDWLASWNFNHLPILSGSVIILLILNRFLLKLNLPQFINDNKWYFLVAYLIGFFILRNTY